MKPFPCQNLSGLNRSVLGRYHGKKLIDSEGLLKLAGLIKGTDSNLEVGINLHRDNVFNHRFNGETHSLDLWVSREPVRMYIIEPSSWYTVPERFEVKTINVYDTE